MGHADVGMDADDGRDEMIAKLGGYVGFDTIGYDTEMEDSPYWSRPRQERVEHFLRFIEIDGHLERAVISADANCCALGWPGLKDILSIICLKSLYQIFVKQVWVKKYLNNF